MDYENELLLYHSQQQQQHTSINDFSSYALVGRKTPRRFYIGLLIVLLSNIGLSIITITIWPYIQLNKESIYILGLCIGSYYIGVSIGKKLYVYIKSKRYWLMLVLSLSLQLAGDVLYATAPAQLALIVSRCMIGVGSSYAVVVVQKMLSKSRDPDLQKMRLRSIATVTLAALPVGAALVALVSNFKIDRRMNIFADDASTASFYGWLVVIFTALALILSIIGMIIDKAQQPTNSNSRRTRSDSFNQHDQFSQIHSPIYNEDDQDDDDDDTTLMGLYDDTIPQSNIPYRTQESCILPPKFTLLLLCLVHAMVCHSGMVLDALFVPSSMDESRYNWDTTKIALYYIGAGVTLTMTSLLARRINNHSLLFYGSLTIIVIGYSFMTSWTPSLGPTASSPIVRYLLGALLVSIGYPIATISSLNLFYQLKSTIHSKFISMFFFLSNSFGRLLGPIFAIIVYQQTGANYAFIYGMLAGVLAILIYLCLGKSMKHINTVSIIQKHVPILSIDDENNKLMI